MIHLRLAVATFVAVFATVACQQPTWQQTPSSNKPRKSVVVQFTDATIHPSIARVTRGGNVAWINYSSLYTGSVVFPAEILDSFTCSELRPLFMKVAAGYQSVPITRAMENVALPCPLKPGEYEYTIYLFSGGRGGTMGGMENPVTTMAGKIVVE